MVGVEIGAAVAQGIVGPVVMEAPMAVTQSAVASVADVTAPLALTITEGAVAGLGSSSEVAASVGTVASSPVGQVSFAASQASEAVTGVQEEIGKNLVAESMAESLTGMPSHEALQFADQLEGLLSEGGDTHSMMEGLRDGLLTGQEIIPTETLMNESAKMADLPNEQVVDIFSAVDTLDVSKAMLEDPAFRQDLAQYLFEQASVQKDGVVKKEAVVDMMQKGVEVAQKKRAERQEDTSEKPVNEEELEKIKKKAAMEAVRKQMDVWRISVLKDNRMNEDAKKIAMQKIDRVETRLMLQTQMKWEGKSLMKMLAVSALWLSE